MGLRIRQVRNVRVRVAVAVALAVITYPLLALTLHGASAIAGPKVEVITPEGNMQRDLKVHVKVRGDHLSRVKFTVKRLSDGAVINTKAAVPKEGETSLELEDYDLCAHDRLDKCDTDWVREGAYKIRVLAYASDGTKNVSTYRKVIVDTTDPTAEFTSPESGSVGDNLVVDANLRDNRKIAEYGFEVSGPDGLSFKTQKIPADKAAVSLKNFDVCTAAEDCPAELPDGPYSILVWAADAAGNVYGTRLQRIVDRDAPIVSIEPITSPFSGAMNLAGKASDAGSGLTTKDGHAMVDLTFSNAAGKTWQTDIPVDNDVWGYGVDTRAHPFFSDGDYKVVAQVFDNQGRDNSATRYFTVDNTPPAVSIRLVSDPTMMASSGPISLVGKAGSDANSLKLFLNGNSEPTANLVTDAHGRWSYRLSKENAVMGTYVFTVVATDLYGNSASKTLPPVTVTPFVPSEGSVPTDLTQPLANAYIVPRRLPVAGVTTPFTASNKNSPDTPQVLGAETAKDPSGSDNTVIAVSKDGWKFFGIAWYWWTLAGGGAGAAAWRVVAGLRQRSMQEIL